METLSTKPTLRNLRDSRAFLVLKAVAAVLLLALMIADVVFGVLFYRRPLWVLDEAMHARLRMAGVSSEFVQVGPYRVHYFVGGQGQPLLLIHGLGSRAEDWTPEIPDYVNSGFRVYAIDLLGCGRTDHPDIAYTIEEQAEMVQGFLGAAHIEKADVIGWSMGGWVALKLALEHPESVGRLVLMDSAGLHFETSLTPDVFEPRTIPQLNRLEGLLVTHPLRLPEFFDRALLRAMQKSFRVVHRTVVSMQTGKDALDGELERIRGPVLIVWGEQDTLIPPSVGERMHRAMPQSVIELFNGCGHIGPATCAGKIVPRVNAFLHSEPAAAGGAYWY